MIRESVASVIHLDRFLIKDMLITIADLFAETVLSSDSDFCKKNSLFRGYLANAMPFDRGSAAIGEWFAGSMCAARDMDISYNPLHQVDLDSLYPLLSKFMSEYDEAVVVTKNSPTS